MTDHLLPANPVPQLNRNQLIEAVAEWRATPEVFRQEHTLNQLAQRLGVRANGWFYELADSAEVYHLMLVKTAGEALKQAPEILMVLAEKAKGGHVRAAQVYLDFVRQVLTDERFLSKLKPAPPDISTVLQNTAKATEKLLALARALGADEEETRRRLGMLEEYDEVEQSELGAGQGQ